MKTFTFYGTESDYGISVWSFLIILLPLGLRLLTDWYLIVRKKKEPKHWLHNLLTGIFMIICAWSIWLIDGLPAGRGFMMMWGIFFAGFDYLLNVLRGEKWYYIDLALDGKGNFFDSFYQRIGMLGVIFLKFWWLFFCFSVCFYWSLTGL